MESLIRSSTLYASETMINMKESEYRALEKIEESVIQKIQKKNVVQGTFDTLRQA